MKWMFNGKVIEEKNMKISVSDHGFLYGAGLFETFRVYDRTPFLFYEHMSRLQAGLSLIGIDSILEFEQMLEQLNNLLDVNNLHNAYVRLTVTAGIEPLGLPLQRYTKPSIIWQVKDLEPLNDSVSIKRAVILKQPRNLPETKVRLKSLNFLNNVLAKQEILNLKNTEGFFLTSNGYLAEGIVSNIFFIKDDKVYTPALETGILNGITRQFVIKICRKNNIPIFEGLFTPEDLYNANEIFITNSIQEIAGINFLNNIEYPLSDAGITNYLIKEYKMSVKEAIYSPKGSEIK